MRVVQGKVVTRDSLGNQGTADTADRVDIQGTAHGRGSRDTADSADFLGSAEVHLDSLGIAHEAGIQGIVG